MANITGTAANNALVDTSGDDTIDAQGGNDTITVTSGRDTVDGGTGLDLLTVSYAALTVAIMNNGESQFNEASGLGATSVTFSNIERFNISTGSGDDTIRTFVRNSFSDSIVTSGNDLINGGAGNDRLAGGGGNDFIRGGAGDDILDGEGSLTGLFDGSVQTLTFTGDDRLLGDAGNDTLYGGSGDDTLEGGADNDFLDGDAYAFTVRDGSLFGSGVTITPTDVDASTGTHDDSLLGGAGADTLVVRFGRDTVDGGAGLDTLVVDYEAATFGVINNGEFQFNSATGLSATSVQFDNVERFDVTTGSADDNIRTFVRDSFDNGAIVSGNDVIRTNGGNDRAGGGDGADLIYGGDGNDSLDGDGALIGKVGGFGGSRMTWVFSGDDMVFGEGGDDTLFGGLGSDMLDGGIGNDSLYGDAYGYTATDGSVLGGPSSTIFATDVDPTAGTTIDTLNGGDGADVLYTRFGADIIDGGAGTDTLVYDRTGATTAMTVDITTGAGMSTDGVAFSSIEQLRAVGGSGDDVFTGGAGDDTFRGGAGSDVINGGGGNDTATLNLQNEAGADSINLGTGDDTVNVSAVAARQIRVTFTSSEAGNGNAFDSNGSPQQDGGLAVRLQAEDADGNLTGLITRTDDEGITFVDPAFGATFDVRDLVTGAARGDQFRAVILGTSAGDVINGMATPDYINGGMGNDVINGGTSDDFLVGGAGDDTLTGGDGSILDGNDTFLGGGGNDTLFGGFGNDIAIFNSSTDGADTVNLGAGADTVNVAGAAGQIRLTFTSSEVGNNNANDSNTMANQDGGLAVRFQREDGGDGLSGPVSRSDDEGITFVAGAGLTFDVRDLVSGAQRGNQFRTVTLGTSLGDTFLGTAEADYINAGMGDDTVSGGLGADFLVGGAGIDTLNGDDGDDSFIGGGSGDFIFGGVGNDTANGGDGNDRIDGGTGADSLLGEAGDDVLIGGLGNDALNGGDGSDTADFSGAAGVVNVNLNATGAQNTGSGSDTLTSIENVIAAGGNDKLTGNALANSLDGGAGNDTLSGQDGADMLKGGLGNDSLFGGDGDDVLIGGEGRDIMQGNFGADTFVFTSLADSVVGAGRDVVADFTRGTERLGPDLIDLRQIDAVTGGSDDAFAFVGASAFSGVAGQLRVFTQNATTMVIEGDVNGDGVADFQIGVSTGLTLQASDFLL
ncbi:hypothetical protein [Caulobacter sp. NIBR1757]|uniref:beta strand repeat-containing protein n=1 Tax=Caulobacter sp. NIBR1757 TaxID=3016000 RepID=UPI0022EFDB46|nr:hypothetical protein [Caulobacter sp. NIBR1757]WGM38522.1 hypothetical protein AMEJIAPC_01425 [Caulobacter sp. NIBR1757]